MVAYCQEWSAFRTKCQRVQRVRRFTSSVVGVLLLTSLAGAEIHRDHFDAAGFDLRTRPQWDVADGAYYGYRMQDKRLVSVYAPVVGAGAISADRYVGVTHRGEAYQRVSILIRFPEVVADGYAPQFHLILNWQGGSLFSSCYRLSLRGGRDFAISRRDGAGKETITSGWRLPGAGPLKPNQWYRLTLEREGRSLLGTIATQEGVRLAEAKMLDDGEVLDGGNPVLLSQYPVVARSLELDAFEYELSQLERIQAAPVPRDEGVRLDGILDETCWKTAELATGWQQRKAGLTRNAATLASGGSATARVVFDAEYVYVGIHCPLASEDALAEARRQTRAQLFVGQTVEVFLDPLRESRRPTGWDRDDGEMFFNHPGPKIFRFAVNAAGGRYSELMGVPWWKVPWQSAVRIGVDAWYAELRIPFASLAFFEQGAGGELEPAWGGSWGMNFSLDGQSWVSRKNRHGYPLAMGEVRGIQTDPARHRWALLHGLGPRQVGAVPLVFTVVNATGADRRVRVRAVRIGRGTDDLGVCEITQRVVDKRWAHGSLVLALNEAGEDAIRLTIEDAETGHALVHRPLHIDNIGIGSGRWDRSFYMEEMQANLRLVLGPAVKGARSLECVLRAVGSRRVLATRTAEWDPTRDCRVAFDLAGIPRGSYEVVVVVNGYEQAPFVVPLRKLAPRVGSVQYTHRGILLRDGVPFFPFGMYYVERHLEGPFLESYAAAGFNTFLLEWGSAESFVVKARQVKDYGLVPMVGLHNTNEMRSATTNETDYSLENLQHGRLPVAADTIRMLTRRMGDSMLAWYTRDEPNESMYKLVRGLHDVARDTDPYHPTMTVIFQPHLFPQYHDATDVLGPDIYPSFPGGRVAGVGEAIRKAVRDLRGKPIVAVLQSFYAKGGRMPNRTELRCMAYLSVVSGATGIMWFSYDYNGKMREKHPQAWHALRELAGEFKQLGPVFLSLASGGQRQRRKIRAASPLRVAVWRHGGARYVVAVNEENRNCGSVKLDLGEVAAVRDVEVLFEGRNVERAQDGSLSDRFGPYDVHIYRFPVKDE
ncbi:MAG: hypothetical protein CMJ75_13450 [Planctomycetaceae bacterium]|nr:hypothetical protein [Planctomycetaceae bacterium]